MNRISLPLATIEDQHLTPHALGTLLHFLALAEDGVVNNPHLVMLDLAERSSNEAVYASMWLLVALGYAKYDKKEVTLHVVDNPDPGLLI